MVRQIPRTELVAVHGHEISIIEEVLTGSAPPKTIKNLNLNPARQWPGLLYLNESDWIDGHRIDLVRKFGEFSEVPDGDILSKGLSYTPPLSRSITEYSGQEEEDLARFSGDFLRHFGWAITLAALREVRRATDGERPIIEATGHQRLLVASEKKVFETRRTIQNELALYHQQNDSLSDADIYAMLADSAIVASAVLHGNDKTLRKQMAFSRLVGLVAEYKVIRALPEIGLEGGYSDSAVEDFIFKADICIANSEDGKIEPLQIKGNSRADVEIAPGKNRKGKPREIVVATGRRFPLLTLSRAGMATLASTLV